MTQNKPLFGFIPIYGSKSRIYDTVKIMFAAMVDIITEGCKYLYIKLKMGSLFGELLGLGASHAYKIWFPSGF